MTRKISIYFLELIFFISIISGTTYMSKIASFQGLFETDGLDVFVEASQDENVVTPGMEAGYFPYITNKGVDAYIRFSLSTTDEEITINNFKGLDKDKWIQKGNYFYYKEIVSHNNKIPLFTSFLVPHNWRDSLNGADKYKDFQVSIKCDSVQAKNFIPDFNLESPWGDILIEDNNYDGDKYVDKAMYRSVDVPLKLIFKGAAEYSIFGNNLSDENILPGDKYENHINIENQGKRKMNVYFNVNNSSESDKSLLDALSLVIKIDGKEFYRGSLRADELSGWKHLVALEKGSSSDFYYEIKAPKELKNEYEEKLDHYTWSFKVTEDLDAPVTGDKSRLITWVMIASISFILILFLKRKSAQNEKS